MTDKFSDHDGNKKDEITDEKHTSPNPSRRRFLKNTGMIAGGLVGGSLLGGVISNQFQPKKSQNQPAIESERTFQEARMFFTRLDDFVVLQAATECIFPKDDNGPGAIELDVPYFIDKQLAGPWGMNARDYRKAPFMKFNQVEDVQGEKSENLPPNPQGAQGHGHMTETEQLRNQSRLNRREIFTEGIRKMNEESKKRFEVTFDKATEEQQIEVLQAFEKGEVQMTGVAAENFFILLRQVTLEGAYSDPLYGGNKNMMGWKMKEFPGAQASYANVIEKDEFAELEPISLRDYQRQS